MLVLHPLTLVVEGQVLNQINHQRQIKHNPNHRSKKNLNNNQNKSQNNTQNKKVLEVKHTLKMNKNKNKIDSSHIWTDTFIPKIEVLYKLTIQNYTLL